MLPSAWRFMLADTQSAAVMGIGATKVIVKVPVANGLPQHTPTNANDVMGVCTLATGAAFESLAATNWRGGNHVAIKLHNTGVTQVHVPVELVY